MRSTLRGPIAFTIGSRVNAPRAAIDSIQLKNMSTIDNPWSCWWSHPAIVLKVAFIENNPILPIAWLFIYFFNKETLFYARNWKKYKERHYKRKSHISGAIGWVWTITQTILAYWWHMTFYASLTSEKEWPHHIDSVSFPVNSGGPETYTACNAVVPSWTLSAFVCMLIKSDVSV